MKEEALTGYCGLYCGDCIRYHCRASGLAGELLREIDNDHFRAYANVKSVHLKAFENVESLIAGLRAVEGINCTTPCGAGGDGCNGDCHIIACVKEKNFAGCWECNDVEGCDKLGFLNAFHGDGHIKNLKQIKKHGIPKWVEYRAKCYPWLE